VEAFVVRFAAEWMRNAPALATSTRYFSGAEQQRLEPDLRLLSLEYQQPRRERARRALAD